jgi:hypothetical protein
VRSERQRETAAAAFVALVAFLPFARGVLTGASLYFRDLSLHFFPLRRFALEGLRAGELRFWNPYVHEGVPLTLPPLGYPLDLLALAWPHEPLLSLLLALHVPLGAFGFLLLARGLGLRPVGACAGALVYGLGGFLLSTVNLYVYVQAAAWAPFVVLGSFASWTAAARERSRGRRSPSLCRSRPPGSRSSPRRSSPASGWGSPHGRAGARRCVASGRWRSA